jgi:hypothetical protein
LRQDVFHAIAAQFTVGDNVIPAVLRVCLRHDRHRGQVGHRSTRRIEFAQSPGMEGRAFARVAQEHPQPLIAVAVNTFARPVQSCDVILHRRLDRM